VLTIGPASLTRTTWLMAANLGNACCSYSQPMSVDIVLVRVAMQP
jgi:hypothetical protein